MQETSDPKPGINSWLEDELYQQYLNDRRNVDDSWKNVFETNGAPPADPMNGSAHAPHPAIASRNAAAGDAAPGDVLAPLRGAAARIAENMTASVAIPVATSQRVIPVKVMEENRRTLNSNQTLIRKTKISYTHLVGWAIVRALQEVPALNHAYGENDKGEPVRVVRGQVNLGLAVDVAGKDGSRLLKVPNIKNAGAMSFQGFLTSFDDIVARARNGKLTIPDFEGTTISLTNPGTVGTLGSVPRLMPGQGAIIATGVIDYPAEYQGATEEIRSALGLSKVMMITCTYDHRVIQGAESGMFLGRLQELLQGEHEFYDQIFHDLKMPHRAVRWQQDRASAVPGLSAVPDAGKQAAVFQLINAYRVRGHLIADLDPLGSEVPFHPELDPLHWGLSIWDLDREFQTGLLKLATPTAPLREILETLRTTYCGKIGCEYMHIQDTSQKQWIQQHVEPTRNLWPLDPADRRRALERLIEAEDFEHFLHTRFVGQKRFSLEGAESAIVILDELLERAANGNVDEAVLGMAHRGRLTVLANIVGKSMVQLFSEFDGDVDPESIQGSGDVKYHLGARGVRKSTKGREINVSLAFNPSHLEAVDPVVEGIVRPKQDRLGDTKRERVIPILIHGDAAFAGQGVVAETLNMSQLDGYCTGGTIHLIINNQIGFTTNPNESRSSLYSTDVARMVQAPIFHVNGDDPEACLRVTQLALEFRQAFKKDVVIDLLCYRRHGHNEADDPSYTQPIMYRKIKQQPSVTTIYSERAQREKFATAADIEAMHKTVSARLNEIYDIAQKKERFEVQEMSSVPQASIANRSLSTAVERSTLERILNSLVSFPGDFHVHPKLKGFLDNRREAAQGGPVNWALAESLAFGSLVVEGIPVRLSGQDSGRGTFSQRHLEFYDNENGKMYVPLRNVSADQARFDVYDSSLSEYAVMGFEFGYSVADPLTLVMWEAQFGDFSNGAQIMIDQFIAAAESKWGQPSGLVLLLPHGYEGQGPEHSSARIERFLQLCGENNMQVANCTTPSQYFHLLRRQMHGGPDNRGVRKPLIIFTPKSILRNARAVSSLNDMASGGFQEILDDTVDATHITRVLACSGKIYYDLLQGRETRKRNDVAIIRVEQLYPFAAAEFEAIVSRYPLASEFVWVQEEPQNMGPWTSVEDNMQPILDASQRTLYYAGRPRSASPAAGSLKRHQQEQASVVEDAFGAALSTRRAPYRSGH